MDLAGRCMGEPAAQSRLIWLTIAVHFVHNSDRLGRQSLAKTASGQDSIRKEPRPMHASPRRISHPQRFVALAAALAITLAACGDDDDVGAANTPAPGTATAAAPLEGSVNFGFFPNVTHAPALVGIGEGLIQKELGDGVDLNTFTFNAGTEAMEALFAGSLDITLIGPNPAINGFAKSKGEALRIIAGSTSGGA